MRTRTNYYLSVFFTLLAVGALSVVFGFVSPDSWSYLHLAQSLRNGQGCMIDGNYFAIFPCGYPMAIALLAPSAEIYDLLVSSKIANLLLLAGAFFLLATELQNIFVAFIIIINPITLLIYQFTWSENLFLFACCGTFFSISRLAHGKNSYGCVALIAIFLFLGCASRYFFAPFSVVIFVASWLAYGRKVALKSMPAFILIAVIFIVYQKFNQVATGYATGMDRIAAPESLLFLTVSFMGALLKLALAVGVALIVSFWFLFRCTSLRGENEKFKHDKSAYFYFFLTGAGYLLLSYILRIKTQYDLYDSRTIGYGIVFISAAFSGYYFRFKSERSLPMVALFAIGLISVAFTHTRSALISVASEGYLDPASSIKKYRSPPINAEIIVTFFVPLLSPNIASYSNLYYGNETKIILPVIGPYFVPETLPAFVKRIKSDAAVRCVFDFNPFNSRQEFQDLIDQKFDVDLEFPTSLFRPVKIDRPRFDPELRNFLLSVFQSSRYVPCGDIFANYLMPSNHA